jgi:hypothetical protein
MGGNRATQKTNRIALEGLLMLWSVAEFFGEPGPLSEFAVGKNAQNPVVHSCPQLFGGHAIAPEGFDGYGFEVIKAFDLAGDGLKSRVEVEKGLIDFKLGLPGNPAGFRLDFSHDAPQTCVLVRGASVL